ncbi:MAG: hypothetical protein IKY16_09940 [Bacteroidales bacterium]|nr:hypothetical protein [Bacteroidales bacterium]
MAIIMVFLKVVPSWPVWLLFSASSNRLQPFLLELWYSEKLHKAEKQLAGVQDVAKSYRHTIKNNFPMEQWERFGITDK